VKGICGIASVSESNSNSLKGMRMCKAPLMLRVVTLLMWALLTVIRPYTS
jgi:hypothetical protein